MTGPLQKDCKITGGQPGPRTKLQVREFALIPLTYTPSARDRATRQLRGPRNSKSWFPQAQAAVLLRVLLEARRRYLAISLSLSNLGAAGCYARRLIDVALGRWALPPQWAVEDPRGPPTWLSRVPVSPTPAPDGRRPQMQGLFKFSLDPWDNPPPLLPSGPP